jgi:hypothetical protein
VLPPLRPLHADESLNKLNLRQLDRLTTDQLRATLIPGLKDCLKTRPDGTILDGHHRIHILRARDLDVDSFPREIIMKTGDE